MSSDPNESDRRSPPSAPSPPPPATSEETIPQALPVPSAASRHYTSFSLIFNDEPRDFENSMLQMLYHNSDIREYLLSCVGKVTGKYHCELARILTFMSSEDNSSKCPFAKTVNLTRQDAQSAVIFGDLLTDAIGEVLGTRRNPVNLLLSALMHLGDESNSAKSNNAPICHKSVHNGTQAWEWYNKFSSNSFVSRLVTVQMEVQLTHLNCGHRENIWTWNRAIKLALERDDSRHVVCSLKDYLNKFMAERIIMHQCDQCDNDLVIQEEQECSEIQVLSRAPTYLIVYLLRFFKNGTKLTNQVLIDERLDLDNGRVYELVSAITHNGTTCENGLYWTVVRERHDHWVLLANETIFTGLDNKQARQLLLRFAYCMMYRLVGEKDPKDAQNEEDEEAIRKVLDDGAVQDDRAVTSDSGHYCGLRNSQFMCYSNSVLQFLYTCTPVRRYLITHARSGLFHRLLAELFVRMERQSLKHNFPLADPELKLNRQFRSVRPEFTPDSMHDAQEYMSVLMDLVHQEANEAKQNRDKRPKEPAPANAEEAWTYQLTNMDNSFLSRMFSGQMESVLTCLACGRLSRTWYGVWQLALHLEQEKDGDNRELNLTDCINEFTGAETIKDDCAPICSQCNSRQSSTKQQCLHRLPPYLIIHLKRFTSTGDKIYRVVKIDETLHLAGQSLVLSSVVCHCGTESIGHYYTIVRQAYDQWIELNDETVNKMDSAAVPHLLNTYAYLCIYKVVREVKEVLEAVEQEKKI